MTTAAASRAERAAVRGRAGSQRSLEVLPQRRGRAKARVRGYLVDGLIGRFQQPLRQREPLGEQPLVRRRARGLAEAAGALSAVALWAPILPRWLAPFGFLLGAALVVSGLGWLLLAPGLANSVNVSAPLLLAFVTATGVTLGLRASGPAPQ